MINSLHYMHDIAGAHGYPHEGRSRVAHLCCFAHAKLGAKMPDGPGRNVSSKRGASSHILPQKLPFRFSARR